MNKRSLQADMFERNLGTITKLQQNELEKSSVCIIGCGGLGGHVIDGLARSGVGSLTFCDPDVFDCSNLNRQLYAQQATLGRNKAGIAAQNVASISSRITVQSFPTTFQEVGSSLFNKTDVVVDCLDNPADRLKLSAKCRKFAIPLVHGAVEQWYGQAGVQLQESKLIEVLYPEAEAEQENISVLSCTVMAVSAILVAEALKLLLHLDSPLHNNWLSIDLKNMTFDLIKTAEAE